MSNSVNFGMSNPLGLEPDNPRESMEPEADMSPDEARRFIRELMHTVYTRMRDLPDDQFEKPEGYTHVPPMEKAKQHYGKEEIQLLSGIESALRNWEDSGHETAELKEQYGGKFVEGVEIGERLAVYQGTDFTFSAGDDEQSESSKFTFSA